MSMQMASSMGGFSSAELMGMITTAILLGTPVAQAAAADALTTVIGTDGTGRFLSTLSDNIVSSATSIARYGQAVVVNSIVAKTFYSLVPAMARVGNLLRGAPALALTDLIDPNTATFPTRALALLLDNDMMAQKLVTYCHKRCENRADILTQLDEVVSLPAQAAMATSLTGMAVVNMGLLDAVDALASVGESFLTGGATTLVMAVSQSTVATTTSPGAARSIVGATLRKFIADTADAALDAAAPRMNAELSALGLPLLNDESIATYNKMRYVTVPTALAQNWAEYQSTAVVARIKEAIALIDHTRELVLEAAGGGDRDALLADVAVDARLLDLSREWLVAARNNDDLRMRSMSEPSERSRATGWVVLVGRIQLAVGAHKYKMAEAAAALGRITLTEMWESKSAYASLCIAWQGVLNLLQAIAYPVELARADSSAGGGVGVAVGAAAASFLLGLCQAVIYVRLIRNARWSVYTFATGKTPVTAAIAEGSKQTIGKFEALLAHHAKETVDVTRAIVAQHANEMEAAKEEERFKQDEAELAQRVAEDEATKENERFVRDEAELAARASKVRAAKKLANAATRGRVAPGGGEATAATEADRLYGATSATQAAAARVADRTRKSTAKKLADAASAVRTRDE